MRNDTRIYKIQKRRNCLL
ncbi:hypothetical protein PMLGA01_070024500 [Plasmodium malariae]|uniref:Uncharacterized protein n=1 Tax=Plasmodium malariae TaxID=5858 RepID=A0A1C3KBR4_PLAMA|nr:hypothetical protein PMLGA01_070024500 [Plasmodium malariae]